MRKRTVLKSPVRKNCTPGSVRGRSGNWPFYLDDNEQETTTYEKNKYLPRYGPYFITALRWSRSGFSAATPGTAQNRCHRNRHRLVHIAESGYLRSRGIQAWRVVRAQFARLWL